MTRKSSEALTFLLVLFLVFVIGIVFLLSIKEESIFSISINDKQYTSNINGLVFDKKTMVNVSASDGYEVSIYTNKVSDDFVFRIIDEEYTWSDTFVMPFTNGFNFSYADDYFIVSYDNLAGIIAQSLGCSELDVYVPNAPDGDLFVMHISSGDLTISVGFTLEDLSGNAAVSDITLDPPAIIF